MLSPLRLARAPDELLGRRRQPDDHHLRPARPPDLDQRRQGTQTRSYDPETGPPTTLRDSAAGTFTAAYDADGQIAQKTLPNGLEARTVYDETGAPQKLTYRKGESVWLDFEVTESIHGQWRDHRGTLSDQRYAYDRAGRLTEVRDTLRPCCAHRAFRDRAGRRGSGIRPRAT